MVKKTTLPVFNSYGEIARLPWILIILTATAYTAFLVREMGYADEFAIPQELIATSHIGLVAAAKALVWGAMAYIGKVNLVWIFAPRGDRLLFSVLGTRLDLA